VKPSRKNRRAPVVASSPTAHKLEAAPKEFPRQPGPAMVSLRESSLYSDGATHPGTGATVRTIVNAFMAAEDGDPARQCDLFRDLIRTDGHLRSQLSTRQRAVAGRPFIILPGGDSAADMLAAERLSVALRDAPNTRATIAHLLTAIWFGFAATEIDWRRDAGDGWIVPAWFHNVAGRRFIFDTSTWEPRLLTERDRRNGEALEPGKWIVAVSNDDLAPTAAGLMCTLAFFALYKRLAFRDWQIFCRRFGVPYIRGIFPKSASGAAKAEYERIIARFGSDSLAVHDDEFKVQVDQVDAGGKTTDVHGAIASWCNDEISKLCVGGTLTSSVGGNGSYGMASVHADVKYDLVQSDEAWLAETFTRAVGAPFVHYNGVAAKPPRLHVFIERHSAPLELAQILDVCLNKLGIVLSADQVRTLLHLEEPSGASDALKREPKPAAPAPAQPAADQAPA
jgi:phage gp29-like protein